MSWRQSWRSWCPRTGSVGCHCASGEARLSLHGLLRSSESIGTGTLRREVRSLVCLSHTGVDRGDRSLAELGLYDIIFSGHAHFYDTVRPLERIHVPNGRLGLLSPGLALGGGISWARFEFDLRSRQAVDHTSGISVIDSRCAENTAIAAVINDWKMQFVKAMGLDEVLGQCAQELTLPDKVAKQLSTTSDVHAALQDAVSKEFFHQLGDAAIHGKADPVIVICNRYSAAFGLKAGPLNRGTLNSLIRYNSPVLLAELSGRFLAAIIARNAMFVGMADFLYLSSVDYTIQCRNGAKLPLEPLTRDQIKAGMLECSAARVAGAELDTEQGWYWCIVDGYVFETLLADMPERDGGVRNERLGPPYRDLVQSYLKGGGILRPSR